MVKEKFGQQNFLNVSLVPVTLTMQLAELNVQIYIFVRDSYLCHNI